MGGSLKCLVLFALAAALWPASAAAQDGALFTVDPQDDRIYQYDQAGLLVGSFGLVEDNANAHGLAAHEDTLYVLDRRDRRIYQYDASGAFVAASRELRTESGTALSTAVAAVAIDGDDVWVADRGRGRLFRYSLTDAFADGGQLDAAQQISLTGANARAEGVAIDETYLYVLDHIDRRLFRYRRDGTGSADASRVLEQLDGSGTRAPYGVARLEDALVVVDASRDKIYTYDADALFDGATPIAARSEVRLNPADDHPRDVAAFEESHATTTTTTPSGGSTSTTVPGATSSTVSTTTSTTSTSTPPELSAFFTVDAQDGRVYSYENGALIASFALATGNDHPNGIALRDDTLLVLDGAEARIYQYDPSGALLDTSGALRQTAGTSLGSTVGGVAIDGDDLWVVDRSAAKLLRYSVETVFGTDGPIAALQEIALDPDNARAEGLAIDTMYLYVLDQADQRLYRYGRDGTTPAEASGILRQADGNGISAAYGVSRSGDALVVVDASEDAVASYDLTALFAGTGAIAPMAEIALDAANDDARDIGTTAD